MILLIAKTLIDSLFFMADEVISIFSEIKSRLSRIILICELKTLRPPATSAKQKYIIKLKEAVFSKDVADVRSSMFCIRKKNKNNVTTIL